MTENLNHRYSKEEERLNILTHGLGLLLSIVAFPFLVQKALSYANFWQAASFCIYGLSLLILYAASTFYHAAKEPKRRRKLNIFDHAAIYVLIAGTYTPFCLVVLPPKLGGYMFILVWLFALLGVVLKLFFTGKFDKLSTVLYLLMGWQVVFFIKPLMKNLSSEGLQFLFLGGIFYTVGAIFYSIKRLQYNHAIFHVFVLLGSISHFIAIYFYV
ncbi:hemolysin III family protein [Tenacibaculum tangerinum]|uniref:Hemolysin III family protein n=1 Tax=Tenacibaculum tangerinum TaxID=3038772 RepID=A0ABY8L0H2_9FLAO|nr:hemolysin III family protein [Tenacibaculum tangerinum]WGH74781.1 hemolysin III family protein [Tenacibaculum tangerinum]